MIESIHGGKTTANRKAKELIEGVLDNAYYWQERIDEDELEAMTEKEKALIDDMINKRIEGLRRYLGL